MSSRTLVAIYYKTKDMSFYGPTGPQGVQGIQGVQGNQGIQGPTGLQGPIGSAYYWSTYPAIQTVNLANFKLVNSGSVGIGVSAPSVALDVAGQMRSRVVISNITTTAATIDFTQPNGNAIYNYLTNSGFSAITLSNPGSGYVGAFASFKNTTTTGLSVTLTYAGGAVGPSSPLILYARSSATLVWSGSNYVQF